MPKILADHLLCLRNKWLKFKTSSRRWQDHVRWISGVGFRLTKRKREGWQPSTGGSGREALVRILRDYAQKSPRTPCGFDWNYIKRPSSWLWWYIYIYICIRPLIPCRHVCIIFLFLPSKSTRCGIRCPSREPCIPSSPLQFYHLIHIWGFVHSFSRAPLRRQATNPCFLCPRSRPQPRSTLYMFYRYYS